MGHATATLHDQPRAGAFAPMNATRPGRSPGFWLWGFLFLFALHGFAILFYGGGAKGYTDWPALAD